MSMTTEGSRPERSGADRLLALVARVQGWFYIAGGLWPLVSPGTFQAVTGPKPDFWLVQTVALQLVLAGAILVLAARSARINREAALLGLGTALILGAIDLYCVPWPRTTRAYWLDAIAEFTLALGWVVGLWRRRAASRRDIHASSPARG